MKYTASALVLLALSSSMFLFLFKKNVFDVNVLLSQNFASSTAVEVKAEPKKPVSTDIENQKPLANPPAVVKALYATSWSASSAKKMTYFIDLIKSEGLNAIVIDIKDYSGLVAYDIQDPKVIEYGAKEVRMPRINTLIKRLHDEGIYVIARQTVFQDPALVKARPDLAVGSKATGGVWYDHKKRRGITISRSRKTRSQEDSTRSISITSGFPRTVIFPT
jgi:hypothetical protein